MSRIIRLMLAACPLATHQLVMSSFAQLTRGEAEARRTFKDASDIANGLFRDLAHLQRALEGDEAKALIQLSSAPAQLQATRAQAQGPHQALSSADVLKKMSNLGPKQLPAMAILMKGMYESWKEKIGDANRHEQQQKKAFEATIAELEVKRKAFAGTKGEETYKKLENYWKKERELGHKQYHTSLKIMHAGMMKFKSVIGACDDAEAGKKPSAKDMRAVGMPDVVFLQLADLGTWTRDAMHQLRE